MAEPGPFGSFNVLKQENTVTNWVSKHGSIRHMGLCGDCLVGSVCLAEGGFCCCLRGGGWCFAQTRHLLKLVTALLIVYFLVYFFIPGSLDFGSFVRDTTIAAISRNRERSTQHTFNHQTPPPGPSQSQPHAAPSANQKRQREL